MGKNIKINKIRSLLSEISSLEENLKTLIAIYNKNDKCCYIYRTQICMSECVSGCLYVYTNTINTH